MNLGGLQEVSNCINTEVNTSQFHNQPSVKMYLYGDGSPSLFAIVLTCLFDFFATHLQYTTIRNQPVFSIRVSIIIDQQILDTRTS